MKYELLSEHILQELNIPDKYMGYTFISYGVYLMKTDKNSIRHITKTLYIDIAETYNTTDKNVEKAIRTVIENIWKKNTYDTSLLIEIFGEEYRYHRPTNTEFFELLFAYIEMYNGRTIKCPFYGCDHCALGQCK